MAKVFIAVGHGGVDPGAVANGLRESDINLNICIETEKQLKRHGVQVAMSRYRDENDPLQEEIIECNTYRPDIAFTQHVNAGGGDGCEFYISVDQVYTKGVDKALALNLEEEYKKLGQNSRGIKTKTLSDGRDYYGFIRDVIAPSVISEVAFIDNIVDIAIVDSLSEQKAFGVANAKAILKTLGIGWINEGGFEVKYIVQYENNVDMGGAMILADALKCSTIDSKRPYSEYSKYETVVAVGAGSNFSGYTKYLINLSNRYETLKACTDAAQRIANGENVDTVLAAYRTK